MTGSGGRSSIPETSVIDPKGRGVLDPPHARGMTVVVKRRSARPSIQHPLAVRAVERKRRHVDLEPLAALAHHLIAAGHETGRGLQRHAAGIFKTFARREHRLLADHALAADFLLAPRGV